ncbi:MAG: putative sulfate exporter family transporter, partial [Nitrospiraceae bacterium]|nr:putative sulfate exporter family transporter [Nitrospiraceae bacterium]
MRDHIPGFCVVLVIAALSYFLSTFHASFDALVISIIVGILCGNMMGGREYFEKGAESALKVFLPLGIALYGSQLALGALRWGEMLSIFLVFSVLFGSTLLIARIFNIDRKVSVLLASGLSVCGASAIAVVSPLIGARREDTSISVISVMMLGLTGMIFYPILADLLSLTKDEFSFLAGTTLPMLGQVKLAALNVSPECLAASVNIKLIRISFLFFLVTTSIFFSGERERK